MDEDRTYPVFAQKCNLKDGGISLEQARFLDPATVNKWSEEYKLRTGDVLVNSTGTGTVGRTRLFNENCLGQYPFVVPDSHVSVIRTFDKISSEFVYAYLSTSIIQEYLADNLAGSTNQKELYIGILENLPFPLPTYKEQQRIVSEIDKWSCCIENVEQNKTTLSDTIKQTKSKILDLAIHGKLVPQDPNDEPASELLKRINPKAEIACDNPQYGKLPKGWCICRLKDMAKVITGSTPSKSNKEYYGGNFPFYKPADLDLGRHVNKASEYLTQAGKDVSRLVPPGTTAVCCIGSIGKVGFLEYEGTTNQQINCAIPSECLDNEYLYYSCSSQWFYSSLIAESSAVTISIVNKSKMENVVMPLPPLSEQHRIVAKIEELFAQLDKIEASL